VCMNEQGSRRKSRKGGRAQEEERRRRNVDGPTNLLRPRSDLVQQRIPHEPVDGEVVGVAVTAATPTSTSISFFPLCEERRKEEEGRTRASAAPRESLRRRGRSRREWRRRSPEEVKGIRGRGEKKKVSRGKGN
jgi:hypothetical protein